MLVGRDLGLPNLVVLVVVFLIVPAIGFVIRRKWRHAEARREEIKRLLVLASEEAARAEIEATEGYFYTANTSSSVPAPDSAWVPAPDSAWVPAPESAWIPPTTSVPFVSSLKPPYQCAVCFSPTSTRCAKCKAVRYCSGRCQIVHWRQGHKDECRPYVAVNPIKDVSGSSSKQGDGKDSDDNLPDKNFHEGLHHKDDAGIQSHAHRPETGSIFQSTSESSNEEFSAFSTSNRSSTEASSDSSGDSDSLSDAHQFVDVTSDNFVTVKSEHQSLVSPARKSTGSGKTNQNKSNLSEEDTRSRVSGTSTRADGGSNGSSFSEPSSNSSGFWNGMIHSKNSSIDELDGFKLSSSNGTANANMTDSQSPLGIPSKVTKSGHNSVTSTISDNSASNGLGSNEEPTSSNESLMNGLKSTRQPKYTSEMLKHRDVVGDSDLPKSMFKEAKVSLSETGSQYASGAGEHSTIRYFKAYGGMTSAIPERSNHVFSNKSSISPVFESTRIGSSSPKASDTHLTSSTSRLVSQSTKPVMVPDEKNRAVTCSSKLTESSESATNGLKTSMMKVVDQLKPSKLSRHCSVKAESETAHRYSCKGIFSYEMFVKLYNWKKVELQPFGLINCGNSCYANAVLQCLTYTPPLNAYLLEGFHSKTCDKREWCFACEFEGLVLKAKDGTSPLSPIRILSQIENIGSNLGHGREEDAHEFLRYAIDTLQSVCLKEAGKSASNPLEEETTLIGLTFGGYLRSKIKCMKCGGKSERHERMMDLTVEIEGDIRTLEEALDKFTCTEILDGDNKYKCSRCKSYEKAKKKLTLLEAPNVLTIALKRFQSGKYGKLNKPIHFPEILDMAPYMSGTSDKSPIYRLYGVVVHVDVMNAAFSGHYVCYVKNVENRWFKIDDSRVKEVDLQSVLTKGAYMLLYARCSPRAPRLIRGLLMRHHHDPKKHKVATSFTPWDINQPAIRHRSLEEESSSSDSSGIFSESCSCSTESSHRDSSSIEDHISWDWEHECWNNNSSSSSSPPWRNMQLNSSDSDTSSSSSSFPSPLYTRHDRNTLRERSKVGPGVLYPDDDQCRNLSCSNSCREANVDRLGGRPINLSETSKPTLRRSTTRGK